MAEALENLAPSFLIEVADQSIGTGITQFVASISYESVDGIADVAQLRITNPEFKLSDLKLFQPGNEMNIWMGYGTQLGHVGRVVLAKPTHTYPQDAMPMIDIKGYTKDHKMMDNSPEGSKKKGEKNKGGRAWPGATLSDVAAIKATDYQMSGDIDPTPQLIRSPQRPGVTDYQLVKGLANLAGYLFWVDGSEGGRWTLHFKNPETLVAQEKKYTFKYNQGNQSSLLSFEPQYLISGPSTKLTVSTRNTESGRLIEEEFEEDTATQPDPEFDGDVAAEVEEPHQSAGSVKLFVGDFSFDIVANKRFKNTAEAKGWARQWFRRQRENFVLGKGRLIGVESLRARQTHALEGLSKALDGDYYFTKAKHVQDSSKGYVVEFNARKVLD